MKKLILVMTMVFSSAFSFANVQTDSIQPMVNAVTITGPNSLDIKFSEPLEQTAAEEILNYTLH